MLFMLAFCFSFVLLTCASQKEVVEHRKMARMPVLQPALLFDPIL